MVIDADAPLTFAVPTQCFETVVRRDLEFLDPHHPMQNSKLAERNRFNVSPPRNPVTIEERLRVATAEGVNGHELK